MLVVTSYFTYGFEIDFGAEPLKLIGFSTFSVRFMPFKIETLNCLLCAMTHLKVYVRLI